MTSTFMTIIKLVIQLTCFTENFKKSSLFTFFANESKLDTINRKGSKKNISNEVYDLSEERTIMKRIIANEKRLEKYFQKFRNLNVLYKNM